MGQENKEKVLEVFYEFPQKRFTVREIANVAKVPRATAHKILVGLKKDGMVDGEGRAVWSRLFLSRKVAYYVDKIVSSGLIDFLVKELNPSAIVLFGSISKGDSVKESDVDIFVSSYVEDKMKIEMNLDMKKFEKKIGHRVQLHLYDNIKDVNEHLRANIANGIKLEGFLKIW
ncbi:MAG: nucleotidyltransferase domain-containing protein [Nanoarchaeota archaeon]|nr:nucleotidyltransferase domain-containing protein [Nanoarchaeota archaeon]